MCGEIISLNNFDIPHYEDESMNNTLKANNDVNTRLQVIADWVQRNELQIQRLALIRSAEENDL